MALAFLIASQGWLPGSGESGGVAGHNVWARCGSSMCSCETTVPVALHVAPTEKRCPLCPDEPVVGSCDPAGDAPCKGDTRPISKRPLVVLGKAGGTGASGGADLASVGVSLCLLGLGRTASSVDLTLAPAGRVHEAWRDAPAFRSLSVPAPPPRA